MLPDFILKFSLKRVIWNYENWKHCRKPISSCSNLTLQDISMHIPHTISHYPVHPDIHRSMEHAEEFTRDANFSHIFCYGKKPHTPNSKTSGCFVELFMEAKPAKTDCCAACSCKISYSYLLHHPAE